MLKTIFRGTLALLLLATFAACGGSSAEADDASDSVATNTDGTAQITMTPVGNQMQFEQTEITVQPGETVELTFENTATSPAMAHNVVFLNTDDDAAVNRVGQSALSAGPEAEYVPEDDAIIAATDVAQPGETVTVTFTAPEEPGAYTYVCTFPGHYATMQGTLRVDG